MTFTLANNGAGGTNGATPTQGSGGNTGGSSGSFFDNVSVGASAALTFDNTHTIHSTESYMASTGATAATSYVGWSTSVALTGNQVWFRQYLYFTALPTVNTRVLEVLATGNAVSMGVNVLTSGVLRVVYGTGAAPATNSSITIPTGAWFRIEGYVIGDTVAGNTELKIFKTSADAGSPDETDTGPGSLNTTGVPAASRYGVVATVASTGPFWYSSVVLTDQGYPGPVPGGTTPSAADLAGGTDVGSTIGVDDAIGYP